MPYSLSDKLVIAISSRALFELEAENQIFETAGEEKYRDYQIEHENTPLSPGTGFPLVKGLLAVNKRVNSDERLVEVILLSRNDPDSGLRILKSARAAGLDISRGSFVTGRNPFAYLQAYQCKLFLSANAEDVRGALNAKIPAALIYPPPDFMEKDVNEVRIAFDGDAVLFSADSEKIYQKEGLAAFHQHELDFEDVPLEPGPFRPFLESIAAIQRRFAGQQCPIRTGLFTARNAPAEARAIKTLRHWRIRVDESHFLGGLENAAFLKEFKPHIFFDDQKVHLKPCAGTIPAAEVLCELA